MPTPGPAALKQPGMKYMVLKAKHHDGFMLRDKKPEPMASWTRRSGVPHLRERFGNPVRVEDGVYRTSQDVGASFDLL